MGIIYAIVNQKGGVGKTTTAVNLSACLALRGARVLVVDMDAQGNATSGFGIDKRGLAASTYDVLLDGRSVEDVAVPTPVDGLSIVPATLDLAGADVALAPVANREFRLRAALDPARSLFDAIVVDGPPSLGLLTVNALAAADRVIIPIQTEYYALEGISQLLLTIERVQRHLNPALSVARVVLTMHDSRNRLSGQVAEDVRGFFREAVAATAIPRNVRLAEAPSHGVPVELYDPKSRGAAAYRALAAEVGVDGT